MDENGIVVKSAKIKKITLTSIDDSVEVDCSNLDTLVGVEFIMEKSPYFPNRYITKYMVIKNIPSEISVDV